MGRLGFGGGGGIRLALLLIAVVGLAGGCGEPQSESATPVSQTEPGRPEEQTATLSREEVQRVYERLQAIDFLQYPVEPGPSPEPAATDPQSPEDIEDLEAFVLSAGWGQVEHGVRWWGGPEADGAELEPLRETLAQTERLARGKFE